MSILVIEDDAPFRELIRASLEPRKVRFAATFDDALKLIEQQPPNTVLLDLSLPDSSPALTIQRIAEIKSRSKETVVIVITGSPEIYRLHNAAMRAGAYCVLSKDQGFFDTLHVVLKNVGEQISCASRPIIEQIEATVEKIVNPSDSSRP